MGQTGDAPPAEEGMEGGCHAADHHEAQHDDDGLTEPEPSHDDHPHPAKPGPPHGRRQQISRGRRFWAALRRSPMDPVSQRPICFAFNRGLLDGAPAGGCPRGPDRCRFAHVPLDQIPGAEEAAAILALEAARTRTYRGGVGGFGHGEGGGHGGFDAFGMPLRRRMLPHSGKVLMPVDPETQQRICFFYNAMPTGCVNGDGCPFMHTKVDLRALGFHGHLPEERDTDVSAHTDTESIPHQPPPIHPEPAPEEEAAAAVVSAAEAGGAGVAEEHSPSRARPSDPRRGGGGMPRSRSSHNLGGAGRGRGGGGYPAGMPYSPTGSMQAAPGYWSPSHGHPPPPAPPAPHHPSAHAYAPPPPGAPHYPQYHYAPAPAANGDPFAVATFAAATALQMYRTGSPGLAAPGGGWQAAGGYGGEYPVPAPHYAAPEPAPGYVVPAAPYGFEHAALAPGGAPPPGGYWPAHAAPPPMPPPRRMRRHMTHPPRLQTGGGPPPPQPGGY